MALLIHFLIHQQTQDSTGFSAINTPHDQKGNYPCLDGLSFSPPPNVNILFFIFNYSTFLIFFTALRFGVRYSVSFSADLLLHIRIRLTNILSMQQMREKAVLQFNRASYQKLYKEIKPSALKSDSLFSMDFYLIRVSFYDISCIFKVSLILSISVNLRSAGAKLKKNERS